MIDLMSVSDLLRGKNCFITGATGGLGKDLALQFAKHGCNLFLTSYDDIGLKSFLDTLYAVDNKIKIYFEHSDLTDQNQFKETIKRCRQQFDRIDILINSAGIFPIKLISESTLEDFDRCFNINVRIPYALIKEFSIDMTKNEWGRIVNIGSSSAYTGIKETVIYCATKHALLGLSRATYNELKEHNVRTCCISPGSMKTDMGKMSARMSNQNYETFIAPREVAEFIMHVILYDKEMVAEEIRLNRIRIE